MYRAIDKEEREGGGKYLVGSQRWTPAELPDHKKVHHLLDHHLQYIPRKGVHHPFFALIQTR